MSQDSQVFLFLFLGASQSYNLWYDCPSLPHWKHLSLRTNPFMTLFLCPPATHAKSIISVCVLRRFFTCSRVWHYLCKLWPSSIFNACKFMLLGATCAEFLSRPHNHHFLHIIKTHHFPIHVSAFWRHDDVKYWPLNAHIFKMQPDRTP